MFSGSQIEECTIEFNAKISSVTSQDSSSLTKYGVSVEAKGSFFGSSIGIKASYSSEKSQKNSNTENREFSMRVFVKAVQDDMPTGMRKILDILEQAILNGAKASA